MVDKILLGIDLGTTVLKVCAFDLSTGAMLGQAARRLKVHFYPRGGREQNPTAIDRAFKAVVGDVRERLGTDWRKMSGIGLAAQGGSSIIADRISGKAKTPMILWNDGRDRDRITRLAARTSGNFWRKHTLRDVPPDGLGRLDRLKETRPELFIEDNIHIGAGEYIFFKLTGVWRQDAGNAIQIGSYNAVKKQLDRFTFDSIGVPLSFVALLRRGHETVPLSKRGARLLDVAEGIPVAGPYIDQEAGYLSAAGVSERPLQCSLGTAWVGNFVLPDNTTGASPIQIVLPSPVGDGRLVVQPLLTGNTTWEWGLSILMDSRQDRALVKADKVFAKSLLPTEGLVALPWFAQANPISGEAYGGGVFFGLSTQTDRGDQLRALAAGMTFELGRVFDEVKRSGAIDSVVLGGGAGKGSYFRKLIAALFDPLPVFRQIGEDLSVARGAVYAFNPKAARTRIRRVSRPGKNVSMEIRCRYDLYLDVFDKMYRTVPAGKAFQFTGRRG